MHVVCNSVLVDLEIYLEQIIRQICKSADKMFTGSFVFHSQKLDPGQTCINGELCQHQLLQSAAGHERQSEGIRLGWECSSVRALSGTQAEGQVDQRALQSKRFAGLSLQDQL